MSIWEKMDDETIQVLKEQKAFEDEVAKNLTPYYKDIKNPITKLLIHRIILDTKKHSDMYQIIIDLQALTDFGQGIVGDVDKNILVREFTSHIEEENKMLNRAMKIGESVKDEKISKLIENIVEDEKRHHKVLQELLEIIKKEVEEAAARRQYARIWPGRVYDILASC